MKDLMENSKKPSIEIRKEGQGIILKFPEYKNKSIEGCGIMTTQTSRSNFPLNGCHFDKPYNLIHVIPELEKGKIVYNMVSVPYCPPRTPRGCKFLEETKSDYEINNTLIRTLRQNLSALAEKIKPKVIGVVNKWTFGIYLKF